MTKRASLRTPCQAYRALPGKKYSGDQWWLTAVGLTQICQLEICAYVRVCSFITGHPF